MHTIDGLDEAVRLRGMDANDTAYWRNQCSAFALLCHSHAVSALTVIHAVDCAAEVCTLSVDIDGLFQNRHFVIGYQNAAFIRRDYVMRKSMVVRYA
jgi:hypothetical protein